MKNLAGQILATVQVSMFFVKAWTTTGLPADFPGFHMDLLKRGHFNPSYRGCYKKNGTGDTGFPHKRTPLYTADNTIESCVLYCRDKGFTYAGVQYGSGCLCGETYYQVPSKSCRDHYHVRCSGDHAQICGGADDSVDVYKVCAAWANWGFVYGTTCDQVCMSCKTLECDLRGVCLDNQCNNGMQPSPTNTCNDDCDTPGHYGVNCKYKNPNCVSAIVHPVNGYCVLGCVSGYGPFCDADPVSINAAEGPCPVCDLCKNGICIGDGGPSYYNCPKNWHGSKCPACPDGKWGEYCSKNCTGNCGNCNQVSGVCLKCQPGYYGKMCELACSVRCDAQGCDRTGGQCISCIINGVYGTECQHPCGNCIGYTCLGNGTCPNKCLRGYYGRKCLTPCPANCVQQCDSVNGRCEGCKTGFYLLYCQTICPEGCIQGCEQHTGICNTNCVYNTTCDICKMGFYGPLCDKPCPKNCTENRCRAITGECYNYTKGDPTGDQGTPIFPPVSGAGATPSLPLLLGVIMGLLVVMFIILVTLYSYKKAHKKIQKVQSMPLEREENPLEATDSDTSHTGSPSVVTITPPYKRHVATHSAKRTAKLPSRHAARYLPRQKYYAKHKVRSDKLNRQYNLAWHDEDEEVDLKTIKENSWPTLQQVRRASKASKVKGEKGENRVKLHYTDYLGNKRYSLPPIDPDRSDGQKHVSFEEYATVRQYDAEED